MTALSSQASPQAAALERRWLAPFTVDVMGVLAPHRRGRGDPAFVVDEAGAVWRASRTPAGPGTLRITARSVLAPTAPGQSGQPGQPGQPAHCDDKAGPGQSEPANGDADARRVTQVDAMSWGPGAAWLLDSLPGLLGADDRPEDFVPEHPVLCELARRHPPVRIGRTGLVFEALVPAVLEQKVVGAEAKRAWRILLRRFGDPAPGPAPAGMIVPPSAATWASIPSWDWHRAGVEAVRARTIATAARVVRRLEEVTTMPADVADRRLRALPGIGPWTSAEIRQRACGDPDAVSVGDYHLPSIVGWTLAGRAVDDAGMLELLAPYQGQRHRAAMLASLSGARPPRRGPHLTVRDYRTF